MLPRWNICEIFFKDLDWKAFSTGNVRKNFQLLKAQRDALNGEAPRPYSQKMTQGTGLEFVLYRCSVCFKHDEYYDTDNRETMKSHYNRSHGGFNVNDLMIVGDKDEKQECNFISYKFEDLDWKAFSTGNMSKIYNMLKREIKDLKGKYHGIFFKS